MKVIAQTNAQHRKEVAMQLRSQIMRLLGWDVLQWNTFQFESGMEYLDHYIVSIEYPGCDPSMMEGLRQAWISDVATMPMFWSWWRTQWTLRDEQFINQEVWRNISQRNMVAIYRELHDGQALSVEIFPNKLIIKDANCKVFEKTKTK